MDQDGDQGLSLVSRGRGQAHSRDIGLCLAGTGSLSALPWEDPTALAPDLGHLGKLFRLAGAKTPAAGSAELQAGRGCRPGVRACGCVHERGHRATHTHTHTLTRPHPRRALGRAARASPDLRPQAGWFLRTSSPPTASHDPQRTRGRGAWVPARPGRGWGEGAPGSYRLAAECAREPRVPPRHVGRTSGDAAAGEGPAELPRPGAARPRPGPAQLQPDPQGTQLSQLGGPLPSCLKHRESPPRS